MSSSTFSRSDLQPINVTRHTSMTERHREEMNAGRAALLLQARTHLKVPVFSRPNMSTHSFCITCSSTQHHIAGSAGRDGEGGGITALFSPPMAICCTPRTLNGRGEGEEVEKAARAGATTARRAARRKLMGGGRGGAACRRMHGCKCSRIAHFQAARAWRRCSGACSCFRHDGDDCLQPAHPPPSPSERRRAPAHLHTCVIATGLVRLEE